MRITVSLLLVVTFLVLPEESPGAQRPQKVPRIGWISFNGSRPPQAFITGLRERGYFEGQSVVIEYRSATGERNDSPNSLRC